ncbi:hypothetical protein PAMA_010606 [Pampus argenteus]
MVLTTSSLSPRTLSLRPSPSTPTLNMPSSLCIHMPLTHSTHSTHSTRNIHNTNSPPNSTLIHSSHNCSTLILLIRSTPSSTHSTPNHLPSTNSTHAHHSPILTNSTHNIHHSTHMDMDILHRSTLTLSTHMALPNNYHTPNIRIPSIPSILSTRSTHSTHSTRSTRNTRNIHTTPSIHVTHRLIIVEGRPEDPHMLVTTPPRTREEERALRCAGQVGGLRAEQAYVQDISPAYLCPIGLTEVTSPVCHLLNTPPLQANKALLILPAEISCLSPP